MAAPPPVRFAVIGLNHYHVHSQVDALLAAGAQLVSYHAAEPELREPFARRHPEAAAPARAADILDDGSVDLIVSAAIPDERGPLGVQAMRHGKDFLSDKPGFTTLDQLEEARRAHAETGRTFSVSFGRLGSRALTRAAELVRDGAIGRPVQTLGLGPHRISLPERPEWFVQRERYGGIITDLGSHLADQFLHFTGSTSAEVVSAQVANVNHPEHPELEDFGDAVLRGDGGTGYLRVDWFTPDGLDTYGDSRFLVLGTDGYLEVRGNCDLAGRDGGDHLFVADHAGVRYIDCSGVDVPYGRQLLADIRDRTQTAMSQSHCFLACELSLAAQQAAQRIPNRP